MEPEHPLEDTKPLQSQPLTLCGKSRLEEKVFGLKTRAWWLVFLGVLALCFTLQIGCLGSPNWFSLGSLEGGLLRCSDCPGAWDGSSYDEISQYLCDLDSSLYDGLCEMFKDLRDAGAAYVFFELLSIVFLNAWAATVMGMLIRRECFTKQRWLPYVHPVATTGFHFLALVIWAGASEAKFDVDCPWSSTAHSKPDICAEEALALSVTVLILLLVVLALFFAVLCRYRKAAQGELPPLDSNPQVPNYANRPPEENTEQEAVFAGQPQLGFGEPPADWRSEPNQI